MAFKENQDIKDWRVKQMVSTCHTYYTDVWSRGDTSRLESLLDPAFVRRDLCGLAAGWGGSGAAAGSGASAGGAKGSDGGLGLGLVVGPRAFRALLEDVRRQYPDFYVEVDELAVSDTHRIYVSWTSHGTQLEGPDPWVAAHAYDPRPARPGPADHHHQDGASQDHHHQQHPKHAYGEKRPLFAPASPLYASPGGWGGEPAAGGRAAGRPGPSRHNSLVRGVDVITFNLDRSKILEVNVFRTLSSDERRQLARSLAPDPLEIRLATLHWET